MCIFISGFEANFLPPAVGFTVVLDSRTDLANEAQVIAQMLHDVGIEASVRYRNL